MKKYYIYLIICFSCQIIYSQKYANEAYTFSFDQKGNFELLLNYDTDEVGAPRRTFCKTWATGTYKKVTDEFYQLQSNDTFDQSWEVETLKKLHIPGQDSIHVTIIIDHFKKIDSENFIFEVFNVKPEKLTVKRDEEKTILMFNLAVYAPNIHIVLLPSNYKYVLTDDSYYDSYSNILSKMLINYKIPDNINNIEILVKKFDICNLYKTMLLGEYIRIKDTVLYWRNEEMLLQKTK